MVLIKVKRLSAGAILPEFKTSGAAGADIAYDGSQGDTVALYKFGTRLIPTGFSLDIPEGYEVQVRPRSGFSIKNVVLMPNSPGTIDSDYRGEVKVGLLYAGSDSCILVQTGERIAQLVVQKVEPVEYQEVQELSDTERGSGGFGSTGR